MWRYLSKSTLKREAASVVMLWLMSVSTYVIATSEAAIQVQVLGMFVLPITASFLAAFGMDWISKQTTIAGPQSSDPAANTSITVPTVTTVTTTTDPQS